MTVAEAPKGLVNKIIDFSFVDGPGNRTVIFLQGCNFTCLNCHNPQTINNCNHCGACIESCPKGALSIRMQKVCYNEEKCVECDICLERCPRNSTPKAKWMSIQEILVRIKQTKAFIQGVTVSGGECTTQLEFLKNLLLIIKKETGLTVFLDTNGYVKTQELVKLTHYFDQAMVDLKVWDTVRHKRITSKENQLVKDNLIYLAKVNKLYEVRCLVIPGYSDDQENIEQIARFIYRLNPAVRMVLVKFRGHGVKGELAAVASPSDKKMIALKNISLETGLKEVIIK